MEGEAQSELSEVEEFPEVEEFSPDQFLQPSSTLGRKLGKLGSPFTSPSSQPQPQPQAVAGNNFWTGFGSQPARQGTFGAAFTESPNPAPEIRPSSLFPGASQSDRKTFGSPFSSQNSLIGPRPRPPSLAPALESEVELITEDCHQ